MLSELDRRSTVRVPKILEVQYMSDSPPFRARISDISEGGIFIDTAQPLSVGSDLAFKFYLSDDPVERPIEGHARVQWNQKTIGMGVQFQNLKPEDRDRIKMFVASEFFGGYRSL